jgi:hypothetical protein
MPQEPQTTRGYRLEPTPVVVVAPVPCGVCWSCLETGSSTGPDNVCASLSTREPHPDDPPF